jgi:hypothetical protein
MTEIYDQLALAAEEAARLARGVNVTQLNDATPCPGYDVHALAAHLIQEIVLHSWDLAAATQQAPRFPEEIAATALHWIENDEDAKRAGDWYQAPVPTASTSLLNRAVARSGRDPNWSTTSSDTAAP